MKQFVYSLIRQSPLIRGLVFFFLRIRNSWRYLSPTFRQMVSYWFNSRELDNYTYEITELNLNELVAFVATITGKSMDEIRGYVKEIQNDSQLKNHIDLLLQNPVNTIIQTDKGIKFGRRIGWYAFVRAIKPLVVVETGVHSGIGSCVLSAALLRNKNEGFKGTYYGTDINPDAGYLYKGIYSTVGEILYGDSINSLAKLDVPIGIFINDSDHSAEYEASEYVLVYSKLTEGGLLLGDNSHVTDKLYQFAIQNQLSYLYFDEKPCNHWYPGGGIGCAFRAI